MRCRGSGDKANAIEKVARECGLPKGSVWGLIYRKPTRVWADVLQNLRDGYIAACEAQLRRLEHEIEITKRKAGADNRAVRAAEALVGKDDRSALTRVTGAGGKR
jgi:hypothetical protein